MNRRIVKLGLVFVFCVLAIPVVQRDEPVAATNPCTSLPKVCRYQWDPAENCCVADPRFDCVDVCF